MEKQGRGRLTFGLGLVTGIFIGYYLSSEEGKKLRQLAYEQLDELSEEFGERVQEQIGMITQNVEAALSEGQKYVEGVSDTVQKEVDRGDESAKDVVSSVKSSFFRGMDKARQRVEGSDPDKK